MKEFTFYYDELDTLRIFQIRTIEEGATCYVEDLDDGISVSKLTNTDEVMGITILKASAKDKVKIEQHVPESFSLAFNGAWQTYIVDREWEKCLI